MPSIALIAEEDIPPCNDCHNFKKAHFSDLIKTHSLRSDLYQNGSHSTSSPERQNSRNGSNESLHRIPDHDSNSTQSGSIILRSNLKPSHSFLHQEYSKIRAQRDVNVSSNLPSQEIEPNVCTLDIETQQTVEDAAIENGDSNYERISSFRQIPSIANNNQVVATQTSSKNTLTGSIYRRIQEYKNHNDKFIIRASGFDGPLKPKIRYCSKPTCVLICGYLIMIIIGIVVSVVATQRDQQDLQAAPRRPASFSGAQINFQEVIPSENRRRINSKSFDYYDDTNAAGAAPGSSFPPFKVITRQPPQPAPKPVRVSPKQKPETQRSQSRASESRKRQGPSDNFQHQFGIADEVEEELPIGRREPAVKIIKSWANTHADGSYTWGYINTDGSFKNETRGADCVVRGIYGYVEQTTGETMSFPYISGNPCDPNEPDYYYDYDAGTINSGGAVVQSRSPDREIRRKAQ